MGRCRKPSSSREWEQARRRAGKQWSQRQQGLQLNQFGAKNSALPLLPLQWFPKGLSCALEKASQRVCPHLSSQLASWAKQQKPGGAKTASLSSGSLWTAASPSPEHRKGSRVSPVFLLTGITKNKVLRVWKDEKFQTFMKNQDSRVPWLSTWEALYHTEGKSPTRQRWRESCKPISPCCP